MALWPHRVRPEASVAQAVLLARIDAAQAGALATIENLRVTRAVTRVEQVSAQVDAARAAESSRAYQRRLRLAGTEAAQPTLDRIIATETAQAFNEAALEQAKIVHEETGLEMVRVWSAEAGACDECAGFDGMAIALNDSFPDGDPGSIHPNCRCVDEIRVKS